MKINGESMTVITEKPAWLAYLSNLLATFPDASPGDDFTNTCIYDSIFSPLLFFSDWDSDFEIPRILIFSFRFNYYNIINIINNPFLIQGWPCIKQIKPVWASELYRLSFKGAIFKNDCSSLWLLCQQPRLLKPHLKGPQGCQNGHEDVRGHQQRLNLK